MLRCDAAMKKKKKLKLLLKRVMKAGPKHTFAIEEELLKKKLFN